MNCAIVRQIIMTTFTSKWSQACLQELLFLFNTIKRELLKVTRWGVAVMAWEKSSSSGAVLNSPASSPAPRTTSAPALDMQGWGQMCTCGAGGWPSLHGTATQRACVPHTRSGSITTPGGCFLK